MSLDFIQNCIVEAPVVGAAVALDISPADVSLDAVETESADERRFVADSGQRALNSRLGLLESPDTELMRSGMDGELRRINKGCLFDGRLFVRMVSDRKWSRPSMRRLPGTPESY